MPVDVLTSPRCSAEHLGLPIPDDIHAVSACLPLWEHNIGYEEGDAQVHQQLLAAYPRFCFHPLIQRLSAKLFPNGGRKGLPFPSEQVAHRAIDYVRHNGCQAADVVPMHQTSMCAVSVPADSFHLLKQYWQHAGEIVSSRAAESVLAGERVTVSETQARQTVRSRIAAMLSHSQPRTSSENVSLFPSGMAAIAMAWRIAHPRRPQGVSCQFGFPYVDTLKIQQRFRGGSVLFYPLGNAEDLEHLRNQCHQNPPSTVFCEVPTNPLLITPDVSALRALADEFDIVLVIDDTLAACGNLDLLPLADILVTSLTKYFSGSGNVLAGSMVLNPAGRHYSLLKAAADRQFEELLCDRDVHVLEENSRDVSQRVQIINRNAAELAARLMAHDRVADVFHPSVTDSSVSGPLQTAHGGHGGLLSIVLKNAEQNTPTFFDALAVCKGPNLGTNFTLCCPYTILAHYHELDFAESCGVSRWLLRISVGIEPMDYIWNRFQNALELLQPSRATD